MYVVGNTNQELRGEIRLEMECWVLLTYRWYFKSRDRMRFLKTCVEEEEERNPRTEPSNSRVHSLGGEEEPAKETEKPGKVVLEQPSISNVPRRRERSTM